MAGKKETGMKVSQPEKGGTVTVTMKIDNSSGVLHPVDVPINKDWTPTRKRDEIKEWINNYEVNGNKPFEATANGPAGMTVTDSAGNFLADITIIDRTGQRDIGATFAATSTGTRTEGLAALEGKPTGLDPLGGPAVARAGLEGAYIAEVNTQGLPSGCAVLEELRQDLVQNGISAEIDEAGNLRSEEHTS